MKLKPKISPEKNDQSRPITTKCPRFSRKTTNIGIGRWSLNPPLGTHYYTSIDYEKTKYTTSISVDTGWKVGTIRKIMKANEKANDKIVLSLATSRYQRLASKSTMCLAHCTVHKALQVKKLSIFQTLKCTRHSKMCSSIFRAGAEDWGHPTSLSSGFP